MKGELHISAQLRNGKTVLEDVFFAAPFKLADISGPYDKVKKIMIMNASPGVLDGDAYSILVKLATGTHLQIETQAYQRIFQMQQGATQQMTVNMEPGSFFTYVPHPSVPHKGAHYTASNKIYLSDGCRLVWGEVTTPGRMLQSEQFAFTYYQSKTEIFLNGKLVVKDNLILRPDAIDPLALGNLEKHTHQAGLFFLTPGSWDKKAFDAAQKILEQQTQITCGITELHVGGFAIRMLGTKAELLFRMLLKIAALAETTKPVISAYE